MLCSVCCRLQCWRKSLRCSFAGVAASGFSSDEVALGMVRSPHTACSILILHLDMLHFLQVIQRMPAKGVLVVYSMVLLHVQSQRHIRHGMSDEYEERFEPCH